MQLLDSNVCLLCSSMLRSLPSLDLLSLCQYSKDPSFRQHRSHNHTLLENFSVTSKQYRFCNLKQKWIKQKYTNDVLRIVLVLVFYTGCCFCCHQRFFSFKLLKCFSACLSDISVLRFWVFSFSSWSLCQHISSNYPTQIRICLKPCFKRFAPWCWKWFFNCI